MNAQAQEIQASAEFNLVKSHSAVQHRNDWSFLPIAGGGLAGVAIGIALGTLLGWC